MSDAHIKQVIEIEELKVIRKYPPDDTLMDYPQENLNRNVEAYNKNNELVWVIAEAPHGGENRDKAYMNLFVQDGQLVAGNFIGVDYYVNLADGSVTPTRTDVRPW